MAGVEGVVRERQGTGLPLLVVKGLQKTYATKRGATRTVLDDIDLSVKRGEFAAIVGPSGAGKTTLLRCIAGVLPPTAGTVRVAGELVTRPPDSLAVVFQDYSRSLLPWLTVRANVELPLVARHVPKTQRRGRSAQALEAVGLGSSTGLHPWQLSGGMQQRVAIARALSYQPEALLMDEPFASVDAQTRSELEDLTLRVRREFGMTVILVTHDIDQAVYLGDKVVVLSGSPTRVEREIEINLGAKRDQIETKSHPEFARLRAEVLTLINSQAATTSSTQAAS